MLSSPLVVVKFGLMYFPLGGRSSGAFVAFYSFVGSRGGAYVGVDCPVGRGSGDF